MDLRVQELLSRARSLATQFNQEGRMTGKYIDEAIACDREALGLCPFSYRRYGYLSQLSIHLCARYEQFWAVGDIEEAIVSDREALALCPPGHINRSTLLTNLALHLSTRHKRLGAPADLEEAIVLDREALALRPQGHHNRSISLSNLAICLFIRYRTQVLGTFADLEEAIVLDREALALRPQGHPNRSMSLNNLANYLSSRYDKLGALADLDEAITLYREALAQHPQGNPNCSMYLNNLAVRLLTRYKKYGAASDLDASVSLNLEALMVCPQGHPSRPKFLMSLAGGLTTRHNMLGNISDLDKAIALDREALMLCPQGHPYRWMSVNHIASSLTTRHNKLRIKHDLNASRSELEEAFCIYATLADLSCIASSGDLVASRAWINAAETSKHPSTLLAYETSLRLLVEYLSLLPTSPQPLVILKENAPSLAMDAFSACLRHGAPKCGVELLEQGRSIFWNHSTHLRSSLEDVAASGPVGETLANKFTHLATLLRETLYSPEKFQHHHVSRLNFEIQMVVTAIRDLPGLSRFLRPPLFSDVQRAASKGPVIIVNSSRYGCDALIIVDSHDPVHIPLSVTRGYLQLLSLKFRGLSTRGNSRDVTNALCGILRELWDDIVSPIVCFLQTIHPLQSRIWWCPTSDFSNLPLHAAGPYRTGQQNLPDLYISSYTPTLSALVRARRPHAPRSMKRFIGIGMENTVGQNDLPSATSELLKIGQDLRGVAEYTTKGKESPISPIADMLQENEWIHFACHGLTNRKEPFKSTFAFGDRHLSIEQIIGCNMENSEFAYLSACHEESTGESQDEEIHLASAMQFIGFRSVIGTMLPADDGVTNPVASTLFKHMLDESGHLDYTRAASALNETMRTVSKSEVPLDQWVLHIHLGA